MVLQNDMSYRSKENLTGSLKSPVSEYDPFKLTVLRALRNTDITQRLRLPCLLVWCPRLLKALMKNCISPFATEASLHMLWAWCKKAGGTLCVSLPFTISPRTPSTPQKSLIDRPARLTDGDGHVTGVVYSNTNGQSVITLICHRKLCSAGVLQNPRFPVLQKVRYYFDYCCPVISFLQNSSLLQWKGETEKTKRASS